MTNPRAEFEALRRLVQDEKESLQRRILDANDQQGMSVQHESIRHMLDDMKRANDQTADMPVSVAPVIQPNPVGTARRLLDDTDYLVVRAQELGQRSLSPDWLAWREALREVVRGNATAIPDEPERYG